MSITMSLRICLPCAAIVVAAESCDPAFGLRVGAQLRPATGCLDSALRASPRVARVSRLTGAGTTQRYDVVLSDPLAGPNRDRVLEIASDPRADSSVRVTLAASWMGTRRLSAGEERLVAGASAALISDLRAACSPKSAPDIQCQYLWGGGKCNAGAA